MNQILSVISFWVEPLAFSFQLSVFSYQFWAEPFLSFEIRILNLFRI